MTYMFHSIFSPSSMSLATLQRTLVQRESLVERLVSVFQSTAANTSTHNVLLIGPRGTGKTHLVSLVYKRLKDISDFNLNTRIAYLREDEWGVHSFLDLLVRAAESLYIDEGVDDFDSVFRLRFALKTPSEQDVVDFILELAGERSILLIIENLGQILESIQLDGQQKLRSLFQNNPRFSILATTPSLFSAISRQSSPFYGFFQLTYLKPLSIDEAVELIQKLAIVAGDERTATFIATPVGRARVRAVQHLAGGNQRIFVLFYDFLRENNADNVLTPLLKTIDALTPYYQSQMLKLSPQQRKIVSFLCRQRVPTNVKQIAEGCFISQQTAASQLKQILDHKYVRVSKFGRESFYELTEPLLRICIEVKTHREGPLKLLVEFLRFWFSREELEERLSMSPQTNIDRNYFFAALQEYAKGHNHLDPAIAYLCVALGDLSRPGRERQDKAIELSELSKRAEDWGHYARGIIYSKRYSEGVAYLQQRLQPKKPDFELVAALGEILTNSGERTKALEMLYLAKSLSPDSASVGSDLASCLVSLNRFDEADNEIKETLSKDKTFARTAAILQARIALGRGRPLDAIEILRSYREKDSTDLNILNWTAVALAESDQIEAAITLFEEGERLDPDTNYLKANLARAYLKADKYEQARNKVDEALKLAYPPDLNIVRLRCMILIAEDQYQVALDTIPNEILSHAVFHKLLDLYNEDLNENLLEGRLKGLMSIIESPGWMKIFSGAFIEFLRNAKDWDHIGDLSSLNQWLAISVRLFSDKPDYQVFLRIFKVLLAIREDKNYKALLDLSLEERRLLVSESEEISLLTERSLKAQ
jgi:Flp pilus assembly protein TadD/DNA-binding MarR family transcriptional regulator